MSAFGNIKSIKNSLANKIKMAKKDKDVVSLSRPKTSLQSKDKRDSPIKNYEQG